MNYTLLLSLVLLAGPAVAQPAPWGPGTRAADTAGSVDTTDAVKAVPAANWRISMNAETRWLSDAGFAALTDASTRVDTSLAIERRLADGFWLGVDLSAGQRSGTLFETFDTNITETRLGVQGRYRKRLKPWIALHGRAGALLSFQGVTVDGPEVRLHDDANWVPGARVAGGLTIYWAHGSFLKLNNDFGVGLTVEAVYTQMLPQRFSDQGVALGELDPSGPSLLVGTAVQF